MRSKRVTLIAVLVVILVALAACAGDGKNRRPAAERGASIYADNCQSCHGVAATGLDAAPNTPTHGPEGHTWHHADGQLVQIVLGQLQIPGRTMPSFEGILSEQDVLDVLAHLKSNWPADKRQFQVEVSENWLTLQDGNR